jgi:TetR/AcrR family transcriptional regulator
MGIRYNVFATRGKPGVSRTAILQAAIRELAREGMAGARTEAIARRAGVNKALLYYYFKDKETLYGAALDWSFEEQSRHMHGILDLDLPPREKILRYVGEYFDFVAGHPLNRDLAHREMMRAGHGSHHFRRIARQYFQPLFTGLSDVIRKGIARRDFRRVDPAQFILSMVAMVIFTFGSAPILKAVSGYDPLSPARLAARRSAVLDFVSAALFRCPQGGKK